MFCSGLASRHFLHSFLNLVGKWRQVDHRLFLGRRLSLLLQPQHWPQSLMGRMLALPSADPGPVLEGEASSARCREIPLRKVLGSSCESDQCPSRSHRLPLSFPSRKKCKCVWGELCEKGIFLYFVQMGRRERGIKCKSKYWAFVINRLLRF